MSTFLNIIDWVNASTLSYYSSVLTQVINFGIIDILDWIILDVGHSPMWI